MTIYHGWTRPAPERACHDRNVRDLTQLIKANLASGWYERHPHLYRLDLLELAERYAKLASSKAQQL